MELNKDFYDRLPGIICVTVDKVVDKYKDEPWFNKAWEEYRQHILTSDIDEMKMPGFVFNKYIKSENESRN